MEVAWERSLRRGTQNHLRRVLTPSAPQRFPQRVPDSASFTAHDPNAIQPKLFLPGRRLDFPNALLSILAPHLDVALG